jgi:hypothetical protein
LLAYLSKLPGVVRVQPYWVVNAMVVEVSDPNVLQRLAERSDIDHIEPNRPFAVTLEQSESSEQVLHFQDNDNTIDEAVRIIIYIYMYISILLYFF